MTRRLPAFIPLTLAATVGLFALTTALVAQPPKPAENPGETIKKGEEENQRMYKRFSEELLNLAQKWKDSENPDDRERAKNLFAAYDLGKVKGVDKMYKDLVAGVTGTKNPTGDGFDRLIRDDQKLILALEEILRVLETEDELARIKREILELTELKKEIERIKREQDNIRARTEMSKGDPNKLAKDQENLANQTKDIANKSNKDGKDSKGGEPKKGGDNAGQKDDKSDPKTQPKPGENAGEDKPETKENKASDKENKGGEPKAGGEQKPSPKNADAGADKEGSPMGDPKAGGEPKPMDPKATPPMGGEPKPKEGDSKAQGENKGEPKPSDGKPGGEGKPMGGEPKPPSDAQASAKPPSPGGSPPSGGSPPPPSNNKPKDPIAQNLEEAVPPQSGASDDLKKNDRQSASKKEDEAIKKLEKALEELEKRLKQLREKEQLKLLANLEQRIGTMLQKQIEVYEATKSIDRSIKKNDGKRSPADVQKAGTQADAERAIISIANDALKLMEGEGSAVVFAGVMAQVKQDMENIAKRLDNTYVGADTQLIEEEVIAQLQLMLEAVKKAKKEAEDKQNKPNDSPPNPNNPNKNLIDKLAELKLIRSLQLGVNTRTLAYNKQYPGEQVNDPIIQGELKQLGDRQKVLQDMLHKMATGANQ